MVTCFLQTMTTEVSSWACCPYGQCAVGFPPDRQVVPLNCGFLIATVVLNVNHPGSAVFVRLCQEAFRNGITPQCVPVSGRHRAQQLCMLPSGLVVGS